MFVSIEKATGKLIEAQSNPTEGTLEENAVAAGHALADIEVKEVGYDEFQALVCAPTPESVRAKRDALLLATDWTQFADAGVDDGAMVQWQGYRQALRDVPQQLGFPGAVEWPELPV